MPEVSNAYRCDFCHKLMEPVEQNDGRWHTKWCSLCGEKIFDVLLAPKHRHCHVCGELDCEFEGNLLHKSYG